MQQLFTYFTGLCEANVYYIWQLRTSSWKKPYSTCDGYFDWKRTANGPPNVYMQVRTCVRTRCVLTVASWCCQCTCSGVGSPKLRGGKMFDFRRITLFCLKKRLSKHKKTTCSKNLGGGMAALAPSWLRLCVRTVLISSRLNCCSMEVFVFLHLESQLRNCR